MPLRSPTPQSLPWRSWYGLLRWKKRARHQLAIEPCALFASSGIASRRPPSLITTRRIGVTGPSSGLDRSDRSAAIVTIGRGRLTLEGFASTCGCGHFTSLSASARGVGHNVEIMAENEGGQFRPPIVKNASLALASPSSISRALELPLRRLLHDRARLSDRFSLVYISVARKPVDFFAAVCKAERAVEVVLVVPPFKQALSPEPLQIG
jgi:hypothetical protein